MQLGFIGLGRMGSSMVQRLINGRHRIICYDKDPHAIEQMARHGAVGARMLSECAQKLKAPRAIWMMIPAGEPVTRTINDLIPSLSRGDILIDGGNSNYKDSIRRAQELAQRGIHFLDVGISGGIWGLKSGYCVMVGGEREVFKKMEPVFKTLAPRDGYAYVGGSGAGHFVKMVHNGIEYGMLQAYGEGFEILASSPYNLDLQQISHLWNQGSVVRSWLLELAEEAFKKDPRLASIQGYVEDSGEGRWTILEAMEQNIPAPVITLSLLERFRSRQKEFFSAKVIAALRNEFGGHAVKTATKVK